MFKKSGWVMAIGSSSGLAEEEEEEEEEAEEDDEEGLDDDAADPAAAPVSIVVAAGVFAGPSDVAPRSDGVGGGYGVDCWFCGL